MHEQHERDRRGHATVGALIVLLLLLAFERPSSQTIPPPAALGLASVFMAGPALQDTNDDGTVDFVAARVLVAPDAPAADVAAAANIAARFGFETTAIDLPIADRVVASAPGETRLVVPLNIYKAVNVYMPPKGNRGPEGGRGGGDDVEASNPGITYISSGTEAPDETARGEWMQIVASAGLQSDLAVLKLLYDTEFKIERREEVSQDGVSLTVFRPRPGTPPKLEPTTAILDADRDSPMPNRSDR